jgi:phosphatidylserine/phosphatidylglycerophosphate/cardiolipin synthase-like enzyme
MKNTWFGICLFLLLESPSSFWAQSPPILPPSASADGLTRAPIAERFGKNENGNLNDRDTLRAELGLRPGSLTVLPENGRELYFQAIDAAKGEIRIEISVLEDPQILKHLQAALQRGVQVRAIVDRGKYDALASEQANLTQYLTSAGGQLHLSNPAFPRSFPKIILVDSRLLIYGSACLDETTFLHYRDFATTSTVQQILCELQRLFKNDWAYSAAVGEQPPPFNPTPLISRSDLIVSPVNGAERLVRFYQGRTERSMSTRSRSEISRSKVSW